MLPGKVSSIKLILDLSMLFDPKDISSAQSDRFATVIQPDLSDHLPNELKLIKSAIGDLQPNSVIHYVTFGKWSSHQLMRYLVQQIGPCHVRMTTWSLTEDPCRSLLTLRNRGLVLSASCILSERISERTPTVMQLARNVFDNIKLSKLHSKIFVLYNDQFKVTVVGSANFTRNKKTEAGVIDTCPEAANFHLNWIENELSKIRN